MSRSSNIELLRIVAMLMIVVHHVIGLGIGPADNVNHLYLNTGDAFVIYGVNIFLLISGYFLINTTWKKLLSLLYICSFYKVFHLIFRAFFDQDKPTITEWIAKPLGVLFSSGGWFMDKYLLLFILAPIINVAIRNITPKECKNAMIMLLLINIIWGWGYRMDFNSDGYSLCHFIFIYFLGHGLRLFEGISQRKWATILMINTTLMIASLIASTHYQLSIRWFDYNSPFVIVGAVCVFMCFATSKPFVDSKINFVAASVFPVYLIHSQSYFSKWFMTNITDLYTHNDFLYFFSITSIFIIILFIFTIVIDQIRIYSYHKMVEPFFLLITRIIKK